MRYVYVIRNLVNNKVYVGQTKNIKRRRLGHFALARSNNLRPLYCSIRKYGEENFTFKIIEECEDDLINDREQYWVGYFDSFNLEKGYNLTRGGNQRIKFSENVIQRMKSNHVGMLGKHHSESAKQKISQARQKTQVSATTRQKMSISAKMRMSKMSKEERSSIFGNRVRGYTHNAETKQRMSDARKTYWAQKRQKDVV